MLLSVMLGLILSVLIVLSGAMMSVAEFYAWGIAFGCVSIAVGGYVTSRRSAQSHYSNAAIMGALSLFFGIAVAFFLNRQAPEWFHVAGNLLTVPMALFGAYFERHKKR